MPGSWIATKKSNRLGGTELIMDHCRLWFAHFLLIPLLLLPETFWVVVLTTVCPCWVYLGHFFYLLRSIRPQNLHSTHITWLTKSKSINTLKTRETKCNSRNNGINHTIKKTEALKRLPNAQIIHENMTFITRHA